MEFSRWPSIRWGRASVSSISTRTKNFAHRWIDGEHGEANVPALAIGENLARYFINDLMRGVDYLLAEDVSADRIGAFGCSGGGTATRISRRWTHVSRSPAAPAISLRTRSCSRAEPACRRPSRASLTSSNRDWTSPNGWK